jgi:hypothetical protein
MKLRLGCSGEDQRGLRRRGGVGGGDLGDTRILLSVPLSSRSGLDSNGKPSCRGASTRGLVLGMGTRGASVTDSPCPATGVTSSLPYHHDGTTTIFTTVQ